MLRFRLPAILLASASLASCANIKSIYRQHKLDYDTATIITVDAKQRNVVVVPAEEKTTVTETRWSTSTGKDAGPPTVTSRTVSKTTTDRLRICAEAAPDVFSAFASSLSAQGSKEGGAFGLSSAETAATIERTQTINLLRESFYRTCERYASGAINRTQFIIQSARDQRVMVAVLAIEQLTGAVRPKSTILGPAGTAASAMSGEDAAKLIRDANEELSLAKQGHDDAVKDLEEAKKEGGACSVKDGAKVDAATCSRFELVESDKKKDEDAKRARLGSLEELAKDLLRAASASTGAGTTIQGGGVDWSALNAAAIGSVADSVERIVVSSQINEGLMFCIAMLSDSESRAALSPDLQQYCASQLRDNQAQSEKFTAALTGLGVKVRDFISRLAAVIAATKPNDLPARLANFDKQSGASDKIVEQCKGLSPQACAARVFDRDLFSEDLFDPDKAVKLENALANWNE